MIGNIWKKISAAKLRQAADRLDPPVKPCPRPVSASERRALESLSELGGITGVQSTFDGKSRIYSGLVDSFVLDNEMDKLLRDKSLISGRGQITLLGFKALEADAEKSVPSFLRQSAGKQKVVI